MLRSVPAERRKWAIITPSSFLNPREGYIGMRAIQALKATKRKMVAIRGKTLRPISLPITPSTKPTRASTIISTRFWSLPGTILALLTPRTKMRMITIVVSHAESIVLVMANSSIPRGSKWSSPSAASWSASSGDLGKQVLGPRAGGKHGLWREGGPGAGEGGTLHPLPG